MQVNDVRPVFKSIVKDNLVQYDKAFQLIKGVEAKQPIPRANAPLSARESVRASAEIQSTQNSTLVTKRYNSVEVKKPLVNTWTSSQIQQQLQPQTQQQTQPQKQYQSNNLSARSSHDNSTLSKQETSPNSSQISILRTSLNSSLSILLLLTA